MDGQHRMPDPFTPEQLERQRRRALGQSEEGIEELYAQAPARPRHTVRQRPAIEIRVNHCEAGYLVDRLAIGERQADGRWLTTDRKGLWAAIQRVQRSVEAHGGRLVLIVDGSPVQARRAA